MTELERVLDEAQQRGRATLQDHLTDAGFTTDFNQRKSMETQVVRAIMENDKYKHLRGSVIFPSENTRAGWADGIERLQDKHPRPVFTTSPAMSRLVDPVLAKHNQDWHYQGGHGTAVAVTNAVAAVATTSRRKQDAISTVIVRQNDELDWMTEQRDRATETVEDLRKDRDFLRERLVAANAHIAQLIAKLGGGGGGQLVPAE